MRIIKFRGKPFYDVVFDEIDIHISKNDFVYGNLLIDRNDGWIINGVIESKSEYITIERWIPVRTETIGQFTGLHDKNGKEIYEGDVLRIFNVIGENMFEGDIVYNENDGCFELKMEDDEREVLWYRGDRYEIIGNIHESEVK